MRGRGALLLTIAALAAPALSATPAGAAGRCGSHPWCDTALSPEARTSRLLAAMSFGEKLSLMGGDDASGVFTGRPATGTSLGIPRLGVPTVFFSDGPVGPREGSATANPAPIALAAGFDSGMAARLGSSIANEVRNKGNDVVHAPTVDVMRTPLAGRTFEGYGEDPYLSSRLAVGWIRAAQAQGVIANVKHLAPNRQEGAPPGAPPLTSPVGGRFTVDARVDQRTLREIYLPPFEAAVKEGRVGSVMCAYNSLNGDPACQNRPLLEDILRREWHFNGFVLSDYGFATKSTAASANNGLDLDLPLGVFYSPAALAAAVAAGQVPARVIDARVGNILRTMFRFGLFDRAAFPSDESRIDKAAHSRVARDVEEGGITVLRNDGVLPLDARRLRSVAVIGAVASRYKGGGGSSAVTPYSTVTPLEGIGRRVRPGTEVRFDKGQDPARAAATARGASVALVFAEDTASEGVDKSCLALDCSGSGGRQDATIEAVRAANPNTVVVLETAGPVLTPWRGRVRALAEAWYPGQQGGNAIARTLFGDVDPGGRLPVSFPRRQRDAPAMDSREQYPGFTEVQHSEGVFVGYRHYDHRGIEPAYPFGHGLSYTRFSIGGLRVRRGRGGALASVGVDVRNTGQRAGVEVAQLYLGLPSPSPSVRQPPKALRGVRKLRLQPGARRRVSFRIDRRALSYWDARAAAWRVAPGCYAVMVGRSSRDIRARGVLPIGGARCARPARCLARRSGVGPHGAARVRLGATRRQLVRRLGVRPARRSRLALRWCVRGSRGRVVAVFGSTAARSRALLVATTAPGHGNRGVRPGTRASRVRRAYPGARRVGRGLLVAGRGSRRIIGVRHGRVRFIAVADRRTLRSPRRALRRAGL